MGSEGAGGADEVMQRLGQALESAGRGDRDEARVTLEALWAEVGAEGGEALHRMAIAHAMADVQDDPHEELAWDLLALRSATDVTDERVTRAGMLGPAAALYPSLHLNLGEDYRKVGDVERARRHAALGLQSAVHLDDDGYGGTVRAGLRRLSERLGLPSDPLSGAGPT